MAGNARRSNLMEVTPKATLDLVRRKAGMPESSRGAQGPSERSSGPSLLPGCVAGSELFFQGHIDHSTSQHEGKTEETCTGFFLHSLIFTVIAGSLSPMVHCRISISDVPLLALSHLHGEGL